MPFPGIKQSEYEAAQRTLTRDFKQFFKFPGSAVMDFNPGAFLGALSKSGEVGGHLAQFLLLGVCSERPGVDETTKQLVSIHRSILQRNILKAIKSDDITIKKGRGTRRAVEFDVGAHFDGLRATYLKFLDDQVTIILRLLDNSSFQRHHIGRVILILADLFNLMESLTDAKPILKRILYAVQKVDHVLSENGWHFYDGEMFGFVLDTEIFAILGFYPQMLYLVDQEEVTFNQAWFVLAFMFGKFEDKDESKRPLWAQAMAAATKEKMLALDRGVYDVLESLTSDDFRNSLGLMTVPMHGLKAKLYLLNALKSPARMPRKPEGVVCDIQDFLLTVSRELKEEVLSRSAALGELGYVVSKAIDGFQSQSKCCDQSSVSSGSISSSSSAGASCAVVSAGDDDSANDSEGDEAKVESSAVSVVKSDDSLLDFLSQQFRILYAKHDADEGHLSVRYMLLIATQSSQKDPVKGLIDSSCVLVRAIEWALKQIKISSAPKYNTPFFELIFDKYLVDLKQFVESLLESVDIDEGNSITKLVLWLVEDYFQLFELVSFTLQSAMDSHRVFVESAKAEGWWFEPRSAGAAGAGYGRFLPAPEVVPSSENSKSVAYLRTISLDEFRLDCPEGLPLASDVLGSRPRLG